MKCGLCNNQPVRRNNWVEIDFLCEIRAEDALKESWEDREACDNFSLAKVVPGPTNPDLAKRLEEAEGRS